MIINIQQKDFGGRIRNGDILGICNILEHIRFTENDKTIKYYLPDDSIQESDYVVKFRDFIKKHTDYLSDSPGESYFQFERLNCWDYRALSGDLVKVNNDSYNKEDKICIFPLIDAQYNLYRNWSTELLTQIVKYYKTISNNIILCCHDNNKTILQNLFPELQFSTDYDENLYHICTCTHFAGGDTGTSHLAGSLTNRPKNLFFYASAEVYHTFPLGFKENEMRMYSNFGCKI